MTKYTAIATSVIYVNELGHIITEFENINEAGLVSIMDDKGQRGTREPHENTYVYAGVVRLASEHHNVLDERIAAYVGDRQAIKSGPSIYENDTDGVGIGADDSIEGASDSDASRDNGDEEVADQGSDEG